MEYPLGSKVDIAHCNRHVRFTPERRHSRARKVCPLWANRGFQPLISLPRRPGSTLTADGVASSEYSSDLPVPKGSPDVGADFQKNRADCDEGLSKAIRLGAS